MSDKDADRFEMFPACFHSCFLSDAFDKTSFFFLFFFFDRRTVSSPLPLVFFPLLHHDYSVPPPSTHKLFSMFLPLRIVSTLKETTLIAKPCPKSRDIRVHGSSHRR